MIAEKLTQILEILTIMIIIHFLYEKDFLFNIKVAFTVCSDLLICELINTYSLPWILIFAQYAVLMTYCIYTFKASFREYVINSILTIIILSTIQLLVTLPIVLIVANRTITFQLMVFLNLLVLFIIFLFEKNIGFGKIKRYVLNHEWLTKLILTLCFLLICIILFQQKSTKNITDLGYIVLVVFCTIIFLLWYQWIVQREHTQEKDRDLQVYHLYYDAYKELIQELRLRQHDYKNHLQSILSQHYICKDYDTLVQTQKKYIEELTVDDHFSNLLKSNNAVLSGFLYSKFQEADRKNILVNYEVSIPDVIQGVPQYVLIEVFGILFDNAVEAIEASPKQDPLIEVQAFNEDAKFIFSITNLIEKTSDSEILSWFDFGKSSKESSRGLGLPKLKQYAKKYKWDIIISTDQKNSNVFLTIKIRF